MRSPCLVEATPPVLPSNLQESPSFLLAAREDAWGPFFNLMTPGEVVLGAIRLATEAMTECHVRILTREAYFFEAAAAYEAAQSDRARGSPPRAARRLHVDSGKSESRTIARRPRFAP